MVRIHGNENFVTWAGAGDAYAIALEFVKTSHPKFGEIYHGLKKWEKYHEHPKYGTGNGFYTDDCEMSAAVCEVLLNFDYPYTRDMFRQAFIDRFIAGGKRYGYAPGFRDHVLNKVKNAKEFSQIVRTHSTNNGSCMRGFPVGIIADIPQLLDTAATQSACTHNTGPAIFSAQAIALMAHFAWYYNDPFNSEEFLVFLYDNLPGYPQYEHLFTGNWKEPVVNHKHFPICFSTVAAVSTLLKKGENLKDMMETLLDWGGDTDTVATISWGIQSIRKEDPNIPNFLFDQLESGNTYTGVEFLRDLGAKLHKKYQ